MGGMNADWLQQLAPDHAPPALGWWPPAPGWWVVAVLLPLLVAGCVYAWRRPSWRLRRLALRELRQLEKLGDEQDLAQSLEHLLRRYALARFGRTAVAGLSGQGWIDFVVGHGGKELADGSGARLLRAAYGGSVDGDRDIWLAGARSFIRSRA
jgi:hypothetical protein